VRWRTVLLVSVFGKQNPHTAHDRRLPGERFSECWAIHLYSPVSTDGHGSGIGADNALGLYRECAGDRLYLVPDCICRRTPDTILRHYRKLFCRIPEDVWAGGCCRALG